MSLSIDVTIFEGVATQLFGMRRRRDPPVPAELQKVFGIVELVQQLLPLRQQHEC
jgi:hypothetical protein